VGGEAHPVVGQGDVLSVLLVSRLLARIEKHRDWRVVSHDFPDASEAVRRARRFLHRAYPITEGVAREAEEVMDGLAIALSRVLEFRGPGSRM
jgi:hypothetical protein